MVYYKKFDNGLRLIINKMEGLFSVSCGVMVLTGSANETEAENGISHFIEHAMFKGTPTRSAFEISDSIDRIGAYINAYTSKECTCYYTKSTSEHFYKSMEVLSDIFFNSLFDQVELEKEKGVVIEEINMCEDTPEDICLDLLAESYYGKKGLGQTILGTEKNIKSFTRENILDYIAKNYTTSNVVISIAGKVDIDEAEQAVYELFARKFSNKNKQEPYQTTIEGVNNLYKVKPIEQSHIGISMPTFSIEDDRTDILNIANIVFGGGMSSRLFQKIREEMGLCYSIYSYLSLYQKSGILEIYSGVNTKSRDKAFSAIIDEIRNFKQKKINNDEFLRGKEQIKSSFIMGQESTSSQMLLYARNILYLDKVFDFEERINNINKITLDMVNDIIDFVFNDKNLSVSTVGSVDKPLDF